MCREATAAALTSLSTNDVQSGISGRLQSLLLAVQDGILIQLPLPLPGLDQDQRLRLPYMLCSDECVSSSWAHDSQQ
jgi:hypothetical protein